MPFVPAIAPLSPASDSAWWLLFADGKLLLPAGGAEPLAPLQAPPCDASPQARHYIGRLDGCDCWALPVEAAPAGWQPVALRAAMMQAGAPVAALAGRAAQVLEWDRTHRHCGVCGAPTERLAGERARRCPACGHSAYPRISPAMMALVWRRVPGPPGFELLLARSPHYTAGMYSALAGFVEPGESIEECLHREVAEEVGLRVRNLRYYGSQSWPFPHSLMIAYSAEWDGGEIVPQADEIEDAQWFPVDALPSIPPRFSISGHLIRDTIDSLRRDAG